MFQALFNEKLSTPFSEGSTYLSLNLSVKSIKDLCCSLFTLMLEHWGSVCLAENNSWENIFWENYLFMISGYDMRKKLENVFPGLVCMGNWLFSHYLFSILKLVWCKIFFYDTMTILYYKIFRVLQTIWVFRKCFPFVGGEKEFPQTKHSFSVSEKLFP